MATSIIISNRTYITRQFSRSQGSESLKYQAIVGIGTHAVQRTTAEKSTAYTLTLTGLQNLSDIVVLIAGTSTPLLNIDSNVGSTYGYTYFSLGNVDIGVFKSVYVPFYIRNYTLSATNSSLPIAQVIDRNYA